MTIPKIVHLTGNRNSENIILTCTGCNEHYNYSVRQYKGDFGCNISEFEQFLLWAKWHAAQHECFLAGRVGYIEEPPTELDTLNRAERHEDPLDIDHGPPFAESEEDLLGGMFPERHEDPWGGMGYIAEPDGDCSVCRGPGPHDTCNPPTPLEEDEDDLDAWMDEELDLPPYSPLDAAATLNFRRFYETGPIDYRYGVLSVDEALDYVDDEPDIGVDDDRYDWEEVRFDFLYDESGLNPYEVTAANFAALQQAIDHEQETITGRVRRDPDYIFELRPMPRKFEGKMVYVEFDYADLEQRVVDQHLLAVGTYSLDAHGCLRDEKGRCLACLRPGPHFPFYYDRDKR